MKLGKLSVWAGLDGMSAADAAAFAQRIESWGYSALWQPEGFGRNVLVNSGWLLAKTSKLIIATGIANIYARDALAMQQAQYGLNEQSSGRFLLGMGVSHAPIVSGMRGHNYGKPIAAMRDYLTMMRNAQYGAPPPAEKPLTVIAALGPKMLELAAELADGAHPYNVTPAHTADARKILGAGKLLCVEQKAILETDPAKARAAGRSALKLYLGLENYVANWRRLGFNEQDWSGEGSDRLIDAMFAWGDAATVKARLQEHLDAGADQVCVQTVNPANPSAPDEKLLAALAPN
ncbi:MAG: TIGR03620 family F420-dependent LLM class oxidoreductase [Caulobacterales bacterium]